MAEDNNPTDEPWGHRTESNWTPKRSSVSRAINNATVRSGLGELDRIITDAFLGHNIRGQAYPLPGNRDTQGYVFFTRPRLNLSYNNAVATRILHPFIDAEYNTLQRALRVLLDPVSQQGGSIEHIRGKNRDSVADDNAIVASGSVDSPLIDSKNPFMDILSNCLDDINGWPDESTDTFTSDPGVGNETFSMADGYARNYGNFDLTLTAKNIDGDPITGLATIWREYMMQVQSGLMVPWPDSLLEFEMDYWSRVYRIVLDQSKTRIRKIASAFWFPLVNPIGSAFNWNKERPYSEDTEQISIPMRCVGAEYNDPILMEEFNETVFMFNPALERAVYNDTGEYVRLSSKERMLFSRNVYPVIESGYLNWWTTKEYYEQVIAEYGE